MKRTQSLCFSVQSVQFKIIQFFSDINGHICVIDEEEQLERVALHRNFNCDDSMQDSMNLQLCVCVLNVVANLVINVALLR